MIFDSIENAEMYYGLNSRIKTAFEFIKKTNFETLNEERVEIDGDNIFAMIQKYKTRNSEDAKWEAHRKYIDNRRSWRLSRSSKRYRLYH